MATIHSLAERRERLVAEEHARALVLFECAAHLARSTHPGLLALIEEAFGPGFLEEQVRASVSPQRVADAPQHVPARHRPAR